MLRRGYACYGASIKNPSPSPPCAKVRWRRPEVALPSFLIRAAFRPTPPGQSSGTRKAGEKPLDYLTITLEKLLVSSLSTGGSGGEDRLTENVTLNFAKVKVDYQPQKKDGSKDGGAISMGWDIEANKSK